MLTICPKFLTLLDPLFLVFTKLPGPKFQGSLLGPLRNQFHRVSIRQATFCILLFCLAPYATRWLGLLSLPFCWAICIIIQFSPITLPPVWPHTLSVAKYIITLLYIIIQYCWVTYIICLLDPIYSIRAWSRILLVRLAPYVFYLLGQIYCYSSQCRSVPVCLATYVVCLPLTVSSLPGVVTCDQPVGYNCNQSAWAPL